MEDYVWVFVRPDSPYNFAMIPPTPKAQDFKYSFCTITRWILHILLNRSLNLKINSGY